MTTHRPPIVLVKPVPFMDAIRAGGWSVRALARETDIPTSTIGLLMTQARRAIDESLPPEEYPRTNVFSARVLAATLGQDVTALFAEPTDIVGGLR